MGTAKGWMECHAAHMTWLSAGKGQGGGETLKWDTGEDSFNSWVEWNWTIDEANLPCGLGWSV